ncbi:GNAT family N-acetyltransferase [Microbacterium luticocti]|uniref:GNAT family N-acetyltransferase n=1 Tax=Microbacterium luticocti TaxID=451764 RepID=UPI0004057922|nr:GNAT family N-acetyltransferase [Microbacterium luticocti]
MTAVVLRPMTQQDVPVVSTIWATAWRDGHAGHVDPALESIRTPESFLPRAERRVPLTVVAERAGDVVGFATVVDDEVEELFVDGRARGTGIAIALLREAEERIASEGWSDGWLAVVSGNSRARRFYEREGWRDTGPLLYAAEGPEGPVLVPCRRYERRLRG